MAACGFSSFKFRGNPEAVFHIAEDRVRSLLCSERDERTIGNTYISYACYMAKTKYKGGNFTCIINVSGKENEGMLSMTVYSEENAILTGFFNEILDDVKKHVTLLEERLELMEDQCPACGGTLDLSRVDSSGYLHCRFCRHTVRLPSWMQRTFRKDRT